jgi:hypothetical protein
VVIDELDVKAELADVLRLEAAQLPFEHHETVQPAVIEEQVHGELSVTARDRDLGADEREAVAEQEPGEVVVQRLGQIAPPVRLRERLVERGQRRPRQLVQPTSDHCLERALVPPRFGVALGVEVRGH